MQDHTKAVQIHILEQSADQLMVAIEAIRGAKTAIQRGTNWGTNALESGLTQSFLETAREILLKESRWLKMLCDKHEIENRIEAQKYAPPQKANLTLLKND